MKAQGSSGRFVRYILGLSVSALFLVVMLAWWTVGQFEKLGKALPNPA